jgi:hypothetical protein
MAIKSTIQTLINTNLADNSDILASEHRAVEDTLLLEIYPTVIIDTNSLTPQVISPDGLNFTYRFVFSKQGRNIAVNGSFTKTNASLSASEVIANIINSDFEASSTTIICHSLAGDVVRMTINADEITIIGVLPTNVAFYFNGIFTAQN